MAKRPMGRPTKYRPEFCNMLIEHRRKGYGFQSFAADCDCDVSQLYRWRDQHSDFRHAIKKAAAVGRKTWEGLGIKAAAGQVKNFNPAAYIFLGKNCHGMRDDPNEETDAVEGLDFDVDEID